MKTRHYSPFDQLLINFDTGMRTVLGGVHTTGRANPATNVAQHELSKSEQDLAGRLMRINHAGEVAAQGLYQGQALTARLPKVRAHMEQAALEENDHLDWCKKRAAELGKRTSLLDPLWYLGSVAIGAAAGAAGDKWSLGFVAETERQVVKHLDSHLQRLPQHDEKTRAILQQMKIDEGKHATSAVKSGGAQLPAPIQKAMQLVSKVMTKSAYWI
ncbi:MAG: 2-polyprenyl-3-methyl-6-methoxy-1,4-benzoquinone monooxygenase [Gammaproteobacteria bacterium]|jgi:ubiquinone biosynthesis monooxygenase Coq7|nr:2-polyprenyl-3-methyl-6-methoxy-1,4-benzoquinone monooxygenase [Gammaproteobacteria bacterium]